MDTDHSGQVPLFLERPPNVAPSPPAQTREQLLPISQLTWEDFERLCLRLARETGDIEFCRLYGVRGQSQDGIDLYARDRAADVFSVYQCRKVKQFGPTALQNAVKDIEDGRWGPLATAYVVCTSKGNTSTDVMDELEKQRTRLRAKGKDLKLWDAEELSSLLKGNPAIVDDFFGRPWTELFCGKETTLALGRRLDLTQAIRYRHELRSLYGLIFSLHDPGIPLPPRPGVEKIPLGDRYVVPDVHVSQYSHITAARDARPDQRRVDGGVNPGEELKTSPSIERTRRSGPRYQERETVAQWLEKSDRSVILGGPGTGKSALLRFLILDLLSEDPQLDVVARKWAGHLPVWVPFAFWTKLITTVKPREASLDECLRSWLAQCSREDLWPLVEDAINDSRLLLMVDGLDESTNEAAGDIAIQLLQVFVDSRNVAVVVTSRPDRIQRIAAFAGVAWQAATLAPLSLQQMRELCTMWLVAKNQIDGHLTEVGSDESTRVARDDSERFIAELSSSRDLAHLAEIPLMLLLLVFMWFKHSALPQRRFDAYNEILVRLLKDHPAAKRVAAFVTECPEQLAETEIRRALAYLAFHMQSNDVGTLIADQEVEHVILQFLTDDAVGLGLPSMAARHHVASFSRVAEGTVGILVRTAPYELAFLHRSFQEYLAAEHVAGLPFAQQMSLVDQKWVDPAWREILLALLWMTNRANEVQSLLQILERHTSEAVGGLAVHELLAEVAFGDYKCAPQVASKFAENTLRRIETHPWLPHRQRLLQHAIDGLRSSLHRSAVEKRLKRWTFARAGWRPSWYYAMESWPANEEVLSALLTVLRDEDAGVQLAAASSLARIGTGRSDVGDAVAELALRSPRALIRAAALLCLSDGWPDHADLGAAIYAARGSISPELRLAAIGARLKAKVHDEEDLRRLLFLSGRDEEDAGEYAWRNLIQKHLVDGWAGNETLKRRCIESGFVEDYNDKFSRSVALLVLLQGFPGDPEVAHRLAAEIDGARHPFVGILSSLQAWLMVVRNFRGNSELAAAVNRWIPRQPHNLGEVSVAALLSPTEEHKARLIADLRGPVPHWQAESLLDGWGMTDSDVAAALTAFVRKDISSASSIGFLVHRILERGEALDLLKQALASPECGRPALVLRGLAELRPFEGEHEVAAMAVALMPQDQGTLSTGADELFHAFGDSPVVREFALRALQYRVPPITAIAEVYPGDGDVRERILELVLPLPAALRVNIVERLDTLSSDAFGHALLREYDVEHEDGIKALASGHYHAHVTRGTEEEKVAAVRLEAALDAVGFDFEERGRAAVAGLLELGRLDILARRLAIFRQPGVPGFNIGEFFRPNLPVIRFIAKHFARLKDTLGDELESSFTGAGSPPFWETMALALGDYPALYTDLSARAGENSTFVGPNLLGFLARTRPASAHLRNACLRALSGGFHDPSWGDTTEVAAAIYGKQFGGNADALQMLLGNREPTLHDRGTVLALCEGWPRSEYVARLYDDLCEPNRPGVQFSVYYAVKYAGLPAHRVASELHTDLRKTRTHTRTRLLESLVARLRRDESVRSALEDSLTSTKSPSLSATLPKILEYSYGLSEKLEAWCKAKLGDELNSAQPQLGYDLLADEVRGVHLSMLDVIGGSSRDEASVYGGASLAG